MVERNQRTDVMWWWWWGGGVVGGRRWGVVGFRGTLALPWLRPMATQWGGSFVVGFLAGCRCWCCCAGQPWLAPRPAPSWARPPPRHHHLCATTTHHLLRAATAPPPPRRRRRLHCPRSWQRLTPGRARRHRRRRRCLPPPRQTASAVVAVRTSVAVGLAATSLSSLLCSGPRSRRWRCLCSGLRRRWTPGSPPAARSSCRQPPPPRAGCPPTAAPCWRSPSLAIS